MSGLLPHLLRPRACQLAPPPPPPACDPLSPVRFMSLSLPPYPPHSYMSSKTLQAFSLVGTPWYMSPEAVTSAGYGLESDVWSLGCLFYELLALRSPFFDEGGNFYSLGENIKRGAYPPLAQAVPGDVTCLRLTEDQLTGPAAPLPAGSGLYSRTAELLVTSMLQVEPSARPNCLQVLEVTRRGARAFEHMLPSALEAYFSETEQKEAVAEP